MSQCHVVIAGFLASIATDVWAVDGVGLGEMFPGLALFVWAILVLGVTLITYRIFRSNDENRRERQLKRFLVAAGVVIAAPYVYGAAGHFYAASLCSTEAKTNVLVPPEKWVLTHENSRPEAAHPVLFESRKVEHLGLGVWRQTHYLTDSATGKELMVSSSFFASKISRPYGCGGNEIYWKKREKFAEHAQIEFRTRN
jgi:hypothetical protein